MEKLEINSNLTQLFTQKILRSIVSGEFSPGNQLPSEGELAQGFGISRTIVREGIANLIQLGVIEKRQGRRSTISPEYEWNVLDPDLMAIKLSVSNNKNKILSDLFTMRMLIEGQAAADAALRRSENDLKAISDCYNSLELSVDNPDRFIEADFAFHDAICIAADNPIILSIINRIRVLLKESRSFTKLEIGYLKEVLQDHKEIMQAVTHKDADTARNMMCKHIARVKEMSGFVETLENTSE